MANVRVETHNNTSSFEAQLLRELREAEDGRKAGLVGYPIAAGLQEYLDIFREDGADEALTNFGKLIMM